MIIIGCDPDSDKSGISIYCNGELTACESKSLVNIYLMLDWQRDADEIELHIENVCGQNAAFFRPGPKNAKAATAINRSVGKCQQVQIEIERIAEHFGIPVIRHPISKKWKSQAGKKEFERVTGWAGRSNEDSRSAAWFGYQGVLAGRSAID